MASRQVFLLGAAALAVALPAVAAACEHWQLDGPFRIHQGNRLMVEGEIVQQGPEFRGHARYFSPTLGDGGTELDGVLSGWPIVN